MISRLKKIKIIYLASGFLLLSAVIFKFTGIDETFYQDTSSYDIKSFGPKKPSKDDLGQKKDLESELLFKIQKMKNQELLSREILGEQEKAQDESSATQMAWEKSSEKLKNSLISIEKIREELNNLILSNGNPDAIKDLDKKLLSAVSQAQKEQEKMIEDYKWYQKELQSHADQLLAKGE